jgi:16S rRNA (guanine1207-N2)-methyltransferase
LVKDSHYYTHTPASESRPTQVTARVRGVELRLTTDSGVFSKRGIDFGTRLLIETVELPDRGTMVDLGCGYGVVAATLGVVYPQTEWVLLDVNERAVELARQNTTALGARRRVLQSDGFAAVPDLKADAILLNPPIRAGKAVVYQLFQEARDHLLPGGKFWIVIHKKHGAPSAKEKLEELFGHVALADRDSGYHVFCAERDTSPQ